MSMETPHRLTCSRAECRAEASWSIQWRNPKIHTEDRTKIWLACPEHVDYLRDYLAMRDFPVQVVPVGADIAGAVE